MKNKISVFWFRRDLRLEDNIGLYHALSSEFPVLPIFIFDKEILAQFEDEQDRRVDYIHQALSKINNDLEQFSSSLATFYGTALEVFKQLSIMYAVQGVYCNRDYEPQTIRRDTKIYEYFKAQSISFKAYKDQVIFDKNDIVKNDGTPYTVYTPYSRKWMELLTDLSCKSYGANLKNFSKHAPVEILSLQEIGFKKTDMLFEVPVLDPSVIDHYEEQRDYPALQGTTQLGIALRFGTISIRECVGFARDHNQTWLNELIWREFFMQILYHFPKVVDRSFKDKYDNIQWRNNEDEFKRWCIGQTGYPIVDAGMRELNTTGYMHNRVRMIVASFLCKHLLIDWRWGEAYFSQKLNDFDASANNGNWQWACGSGCDASPYFRVFNPQLQVQKFDRDASYIKKWIPELNTKAYPIEIVEHAYARQRALEIYKKALA